MAMDPTEPDVRADLRAVAYASAALLGGAAVFGGLSAAGAPWDVVIAGTVVVAILMLGVMKLAMPASFRASSRYPLLAITATVVILAAAIGMFIRFRN